MSQDFGDQIASLEKATLSGFADLRDAMEHGFARLSGGQSETNARLDRLERKFDRIEARVEHLEAKERKKR